MMDENGGGCTCVFTLEVRKYLPVIDGPLEPLTVSQRVARLLRCCPADIFDPLQIIWLQLEELNKWALMCFSELLSIALLVSRARRLLRGDRPWHREPFSPQSSSLPAECHFCGSPAFLENHRLVKGRPIMITAFFCMLTCNYLESVV